MSTDHEANALRARVAADFAAALGPHWKSKLAAALGLRLSNVSRMFAPPVGRTDKPSPSMAALAELLRDMPADKRPARWR